MLGKSRGGKDFLPQITEFDINEPAAARIIAVPLEKAVGMTVVAVNVHSIDLEPQGVWNRPDQAAHATVAYRNTFFTAGCRAVINQIGAFQQLAVVQCEERGQGLIGRRRFRIDLAGDKRRGRREHEKFAARTTRSRIGLVLTPQISVLPIIW